MHLVHFLDDRAGSRFGGNEHLILQGSRKLIGPGMVSSLSYFRTRQVSEERDASARFSHGNLATYHNLGLDEHEDGDTAMS